MRQRGFEIAHGWEDKGIELPRRSTSHAAGYDIAAAEDVTVPPFRPGTKPSIIPTGLKAYCQPDECFLVFNRSSSPKRGIVLANGVGVIDADFYNNPDDDGHFRVLIYNTLDHDLKIKKGDRIAQVVFQKFLTVDGDRPEGERRRGGIGSTTDLKIVFDCDDVLWPMTKRVNRLAGIPDGKQTVFNVDEDPNLSEAERWKMTEIFHDGNTFIDMNFYPAAKRITEVETYGAKVYINSNAFSEDVVKSKQQQLKKLLPEIPADRIRINLVTPHSNRKQIESDVFIFVDDSPYNIRASNALINLVPRMSYNTTNTAKAIMLEKGGQIVKGWREKLANIVHSDQKVIIPVKDLAEANRFIIEAIKLKKGI